MHLPSPTRTPSHRTLPTLVLAAAVVSTCLFAHAQPPNAGPGPLPTPLRAPSPRPAAIPVPQAAPPQQASQPVKPSAAIPATAPTHPAVPQPTSPAVQTARLSPAQLPPQRAEVHYVNGRLTVQANNSSLNQILADVARETHVRITGGVADERVFGTYGPAHPGRILNQLLAGTGSNMLILAGPNSTITELVLTPRQGGPTPPGPSTYVQSSSQAQEIVDRPPDGRSGPPRGFPGAPGGPSTFGSNPNVNPADSQQSYQPQETSPADSPTAPPADSTGVQSPNGVLTPQQIYEQMLKLQQQNVTPPPN